jgi:ABC-2 type transport system permease protein
MLFVLAMREFAGEITQLLLRFPILQKMIHGLLGADLAGDASLTSLITIGLAHPLLFAISWAFLITTGTRVVADEIDRGTADLLLTLPVSRVGALASVSLVCFGTAVVLGVAPWCGAWLGQQAFGVSEPLALARLWIPIANLCAMYLTVTSLTLFVSCVVSRRSTAVAIVLTVLLASFLINFLAVFLPLVARFSFLGLLYYYHPLENVRSGEWPLREIGVLCGAAVVFWSMGLGWFSRRDIPAA